MKNILAIVQARMGSSRLPGKSIKTIGNNTLIEKVIKRLQLSKKINNIALAVPNTEKDKILADIAKNNNIQVYMGSENNVLDRYYQTALQFKGDVILRITGDCPLIDASLIDELLEIYLASDYDYVSNHVEQEFPRGFDCEIFSFEVLKQMHDNAKEDYEKEHVTPYIYLNPDKFTIFHKKANKDFYRPDYRICVDTKEDFELICKIYKTFNDRIDISASEIIKLLDEHPELTAINKHIEQKKLKE
jgi:spore coat polysaccharide biosynthesis protein SpsF